MPRAASTTLRHQQAPRVRSLVPQRVSRVRPLLLMVGLATGCATAIPANSMTLGGITEQSQLGEPLRIVIPVSTQNAEELSPDCVKVVSTRAKSIDDLPEVSFATIALERGAVSSRLVVTTRSPVNDPAVRITLQAGCQEEVRREYLMLLDPPVTPAPVLEANVDLPSHTAATSSNDDFGSMPVAALAVRVEPETEVTNHPQAVTTSPRSSTASPPPTIKNSTRNPAPRKSASTLIHSPRLAISRSTSDGAAGQPTSIARMSKSEQMAAVEEQEVVLRKRIEQLTILVERMQQERIALLSAEVERLQSELRESEAARRAAENAVRTAPLHAIARWNTENWPLAASVLAIAGLTGTGVYAWRRRKPRAPMASAEPPLMSDSASGIVGTYLDDVFPAYRPIRPLAVSTPLAHPVGGTARSAQTPHEEEFEREVEDSRRSATVGDISLPGEPAHAPNGDIPLTLRARSA